MSEDQNIESKLIIEGEDRATPVVEKVEQSLKDATKESENLSKVSQRQIDATVKKYAKLAEETRSASKAQKDLSSELNKLGGSKDEISKATAEFDRLTQSIRDAEERTQQLNDRFSRTSDSVGTLGDLGSAGAGVGGALSTVGLGGAGSAVGGFSEIIELGETLPRLKEAAVGLPTSIGNAVTALGPAGLGLTAVLGGLAIGAALASRAAQKQREETQRQIEALRTASEFAQTATTETIQQRQEELRQQALSLQAQRQELEEQRQGQLNANRDDLGLPGLSNSLQEAAASTGIFFGGVDALGDSIRDLDREIATANAEIGQLDDQMNSLAVQTNELRIRQQELQDAQVRRFENEADFARQNQQLAQQGTQAIQQRIEAIQSEIPILQELITNINAVGGDTTELTQQMERLRAEETSLATEGYALAYTLELQRTQTEEFNSALLERASSAGELIRQEAQLQQLTEDQIAQRVTQLAVERRALEAERNILQIRAENGDVSEQVTQRLDTLNQSLEENATLQLHLANDLLPLAQAREREQDAIQATEDAIEEANRQRESQIDAVIQYNDGLEQLDQQHRDNLLKLEADFQQKQIDIATKAAEDAQKALENLNQRRTDLQRDLVNEENQAYIEAQLSGVEDRIKFQEAEAKAFRDHQRNLLKIREDASAQEAELERDLDFSGILKLRRDTSKSLSDANRDFGFEQQDRTGEFQSQEQEQARHFEAERQSRLQNFQLQLQDADRQYQQERQQAELTRQRALQQNQQAQQQALNQEAQRYQQEQVMRQQSIMAQLQQIAQGETEILKIRAQAYAQAQQLLSNQAGQTASNPNNKPQRNIPIVARAEGGSLSAGQTAMVNEQFIAGGRHVELPGAGIFTPFQGGMVQPAQASGANMTVHLTQYITGSNPQEIAIIARQQVIKGIDYFAKGLQR